MTLHLPFLVIIDNFISLFKGLFLVPNSMTDTIHSLNEFESIHAGGNFELNWK